jgi:hypothetical protein
MHTSLTKAAYRRTRPTNFRLLSTILITLVLIAGAVSFTQIVAAQMWCG